MVTSHSPGRSWFIPTNKAEVGTDHSTLSNKEDGGGVIDHADGSVSTAKVADDAITVDKLAHNIDATGIGFDADKVDGYDAADFATSGPGSNWFTFEDTPGTGSITWESGNLDFDVRLINDDKYAYETVNDIGDMAYHSMEFYIKRDANAGGTITFFGGYCNTNDYFGTTNQVHVGFEQNGNQMYAVNGSGAARTRTAIGAAGAMSAKLHCKYIWLPGVCLFYLDGVLVATHTTNLPVAATNCQRIFHARGTIAAQRHIYVSPLVMSRPNTGEWLTVVDEQDTNVGSTTVTIPGTAGTWDELDITVEVMDAANAAQIELQINSDVGANYDLQSVRVDETPTVTGISQAAQNQWTFGNAAGAAAEGQILRIHFIHRRGAAVVDGFFQLGVDFPSGAMTSESGRLVQQNQTNVTTLDLAEVTPNAVDWRVQVRARWNGNW